jgi:hypothetical protein
MIIEDNRLKKYFIVSPIGLSLVAYFVFLIAMFFPKEIYEELLQEPDLMFLDQKTHFFVLSVIGSFIIGVSILKEKDLPLITINTQLIQSTNLILIPLFFAIILNLVSVMIFLKNNPWMLTGWLSDSALVKDELNSTDGLSEALPVLFGVCWWSARNLILREAVFGTKEIYIRLALSIAILFAMLTAMMKAARYDLIPGVLGFLLVIFFYKNRLSSSETTSMFRDFSKILLFASILFILLSLLRGIDNFLDLVANIMGYTLTSYNRLTGILNGTLKFHFSGTGTYAFRFFTHIPVLESIFNISSLLNMPDSEVVWKSEFIAVDLSGLRRDFIWASSFGYVFDDIGMWVYLYFFIYGLIMSKLWNGFLKGTVFSVVIYPWFLFCVLFWFGSNFIVYPRLVTFFGLAFLLAVYEQLIILFNEHKIKTF